MVGMQVTLGISTLLLYVPVNLAAAHQAGSLTLFTICLWFRHCIRKGNVPVHVPMPRPVGMGQAQRAYHTMRAVKAKPHTMTKEAQSN
jgi:hypothetical protein